MTVQSGLGYRVSLAPDEDVAFTSNCFVACALCSIGEHKHGADLLFQIISERYERAPIVITTNRAYKHWAQIFNNDSTLTSAILDRVMHHVDTVVIEGKSFRMKDEVEE
jgi:DNA replication protein DnaC